MNIEKLYQAIKNWFRPTTTENQELIVRFMKTVDLLYSPGTRLYIEDDEFWVLNTEWDYKEKCPVLYCENTINHIPKKVWLTDYKFYDIHD